MEINLYCQKHTFSVYSFMKVNELSVSSSSEGAFLTQSLCCCSIALIQTILLNKVNYLGNFILFLEGWYSFL